MNKLLEVYDDLIPSSTQEYIDNLIHNKDIDQINKYGSFPLYYNDSLTRRDLKSAEPGFTNTFLNFNSHALNHNGYLLSPLFFLSSSLNFIFNQIFLGRVFVQSPSNNPKAQTIHQDIPDPHYVCLYYVNDSDGDTVFFDDNNNEIKRVSPKRGRIAFFDGSILHCGSSPSTTTRTVINICFNI